MKTIILSKSHCLRAMVLALCFSAVATVRAQAVRFGSMVDDTGVVADQLVPVSSTPVSSTPILSYPSPPTMYSAPVPTVTYTAAAYSPPASSLGGSSFDPYAPSLAQAPSPYIAPPQSPPPFASPGSYPPATMSPYTPPPPSLAPGAAPPTYSPYTPAPYSPPPGAAPYSPTPGALYPEGLAVAPLVPAAGIGWGQPTRFLQEVRGRFTWLSPMGSNKLGVDTIDTNATFAIPFFRSNAPLLVTPGFSMYFFDGPVSSPSNGFADLPARTYDAFVDGAWHPQVTPWFGANLGVRVGAYTDFNTFTTNSIRVMGRGLGIVTLTPTLQIAAGIVYIDRVSIKLLPAGGLIWIPNPDARYEILFPNPKLAHRWTTIGNTDLWIYGTGEYGGGSWTVQRASGQNDEVDYNDIRVAVGLETYGHRGLHANFEVGYVFNRQIVYRFSNTPQFDPSDTLMLRLGLAY